MSSARSPESILCEIERARRELYRVAQRTDSWGEVLRISRELDSLIAEFMASVAATKTEEDEDGLF
ncbi:MAG: aspartyl-phosphate phosphatase Spo0E family protein [Bacillota bacterium]